MEASGNGLLFWLIITKCILLFLLSSVHPLGPKSESQHQFSHHTVNTYPKEKVIRINIMITNVKLLHTSSNKFFPHISAVITKCVETTHSQENLYMVSLHFNVYITKSYSSDVITAAKFLENYEGGVN